MNSADIKALFERRARAMARRPAFGRCSGQAVVRLGADFTCHVEHDTGPHPDELMRASLGASLAMGYRLWGARLGVTIDAVEVEITCDYDVRGQLGLSNDVAVGWQQVRFEVRITSAEPDEAVRRVVTMADRHSPMLANLAASVGRVHLLSIVRTDAR